MKNYSHVLVAVDLSDESTLVADRAQMIATLAQAELSIMHVIEPINFAYGGDIPMDLTVIQDQLNEHARERLREIGSYYQIPRQKQHVIAGLAQQEIHRFAQRENVDLVVVGSHGRHGLSLLFGSTSNALMHRSECDVLAVRVAGGPSQ